MNTLPAPRPDLTLDEIIEDLRLLVDMGVFPPTGKYPQTDASRPRPIVTDPHRPRPLSVICADVDRLQAAARSGRW